MIRRDSSGGDQKDLFTANFVDIPVLDQRDLLGRQFFSSVNRPRLTPIQCSVGDVWTEVSANPQFRMATIRGANFLIWASTSCGKPSIATSPNSGRFAFSHALYCGLFATQPAEQTIPLCGRH